MGIITISCRGLVVSCNTQNAVFSLVFPELCFFQSFLQGKLNDLVGAKKKKKEYWSPFPSPRDQTQVSHIAGRFFTV